MDCSAVTRTANSVQLGTAVAGVRWTSELASKVHPWVREPQALGTSREKLLVALRRALPETAEELRADPELAEGLRYARSKYYKGATASFHPAGEAVAGIAAATHSGREDCATVVDLWIEDGGLVGALDAALAARHLIPHMTSIKPGSAVTVTKGHTLSGWLDNGDTRRVRRLRERLCAADDASYAEARRHANSLWKRETQPGRCALSYLFPAEAGWAAEEAARKPAPLNDNLAGDAWLVAYRERIARSLLLCSLESADLVVEVAEENEAEHVFLMDGGALTLVARHGDGVLPLFARFRDLPSTTASPRELRPWIEALEPLHSQGAAEFALACVGRTREATTAAKEYLLAHGESAVSVLVDALAGRRHNAAFVRSVLEDLAENPDVKDAVKQHAARLPEAEVRRYGLRPLLTPNARQKTGKM